METIAHPELVIPKGKTVVWSPLFQATWEALNRKCGGTPVRVDPPHEVMAKLDAFQFEAKSVLPDGSWQVWAGPATQEFLTQVNKEAAGITKEKEGPFHLEGGTPDSVAAFGLLDREIEFTRALYRSGKKPLEFKTASGSSPSHFFGVAGSLSARPDGSIHVLSYEPHKKSHAVELRCKNGDEAVVLYLPPADQDFATACATLRKSKSDFKVISELAGAINDPLLHEKDDLRVPYVSFDLRSDFPELTTSVRYHGAEKVPWRIFRAEQFTRFELDEKGARVRVETGASADPFGAPPPPPPTVPRDFIHDRPFFIFLWRDNAEWPYFSAWIGDASALKPFP